MHTKMLLFITQFLPDNSPRAHRAARSGWEKTGLVVLVLCRSSGCGLGRSSGCGLSCISGCGLSCNSGCGLGRSSGCGLSCISGCGLGRNSGCGLGHLDLWRNGTVSHDRTTATTKV